MRGVAAIPGAAFGPVGQRFRPFLFRLLHGDLHEAVERIVKVSSAWQGTAAAVREAVHIACLFCEGRSLSLRATTNPLTAEATLSAQFSAAITCESVGSAWDHETRNSRLCSLPRCASVRRAKLALPGPDVQQIYHRLLPQIDKIPAFDHHAHPGFADDPDVDAMAAPPDASAASAHARRQSRTRRRRQGAVRLSLHRSFSRARASGWSRRRAELKKQHRRHRPTST